MDPSGELDIELAPLKITRTKEGNHFIDFNGNIKVHNCSISPFTTVRDLEAVVTTEGTYKTQTGLLENHTTFEARKMTIAGRTLTDIKTDINYDPQSRTWTSNNLTTNYRKGAISGRILLKTPREAAPEYLIDTGFYDIDLRELLSETPSPESEAKNDHSGKMNGEICIKGQLGEMNHSLGRCRFSISDMKAGKMSLLTQVLMVLKLSSPEEYAFDKLFIDSYLKNNTLFLQKIDIAGDSLAFNGSGNMNIENQQIDLKLTARGQRVATAEPSVLESLTDTIGLAVVKKKKKGTYQDPEIITTTLPILKGPLEIFGKGN